jgi:hypothetical protein
MYDKEQDWVGATFGRFNLCKCYDDVVEGLARDGLGFRLMGMGWIPVPSCCLAKVPMIPRLEP